MCCRGCAAVAQAIVDGGLSDFYRHRTAPAPTGQEPVPEFLERSRVYDQPVVQDSFARRLGEHQREASLIIEGITCAACLWLNERHLASLPGVLEVNINYATRRARLRWDETRIRFSDILRAVTEIGYLAHPYDPGRQQEVLERERKQHLRRLGVAGALGMQVMMLAVALYGGDWFGIETPMRDFLRRVSLVLTLPVLLYSAAPFFRNAWGDLRRWRAGMDVPVSLGMAIAFAGSVHATVTGGGAVYYDSVVMFVFLLTGARYFELAGRRRAAAALDALVQLLPATATRVRRADGSESEEVVAVAELVAGDWLRVRPGETVPADGELREGRSGVDEALLTGESTPVVRGPGDPLIGGSINRDSPLLMEVTRCSEDSVISSIVRLLDRAQSEKPALAMLADRVAGWFVAGVLVLASAVGIYWGMAAPGQWLPVTVAVLVVTCPCALSLATPAAIAAATGSLTRLGLLTTRGHALETLARTSHMVFDKTGTLTEGRLKILRSELLDSNADPQQLQCIAAALETGSEHPLARALRTGVDTNSLPVATAVENTPGGGVRGQVAGRTWCLGTPEFVAGCGGPVLDPQRLAALQEPGRSLALLASESGPAMAFLLEDSLRADAAGAVAQLRHLGVNVILMTGDHRAVARRMAAAAGIEELAWSMTPDRKLAAVQALQDSGAVLAMVGDGVNDAPVLARAQVSVAMGGGTHLAAASADMILLSERLAVLPAAVATARRSLRVIRQNLGWAVTYNLVALPLAAAGMVPPWAAALGMSLSSALVVANALRLTK